MRNTFQGLHSMPKCWSSFPRNSGRFSWISLTGIWHHSLRQQITSHQKSTAWLCSDLTKFRSSFHFVGKLITLQARRNLDSSLALLRYATKCKKTMAKCRSALIDSRHFELVSSPARINYWLSSALGYPNSSRLLPWALQLGGLVRQTLVRPWWGPYRHELEKQVLVWLAPVLCN